VGCDVVFIGKVGNDIFGDNMCSFLATYKLDKNIIVKDAVATGTAVIYVDDAGENSITVISGANKDLSFEDCLLLNEANNGDYLLLQNEISVDLTYKLLKYAKSMKMTTVINVAPALELPKEVIEDIDILIVNEHEYKISLARKLDISTTSKEIEEDLLILSKELKIDIVLTLGEKGAVAVFNGEVYWVSGIEVEVVDTTGAGDCFSGSLVAALASGIKQSEALSFANAAAALSVTKAGASKSYFTKEEVLDFIKINGINKS